MIYLDHAATSWPKPASVPAAVTHFLCDIGATPGRSGHRLALEAERIRFDAREAVGKLLGVADPQRVVFMSNATTAINLVLRGLLSPGDHVVATGMEHNAVLRPLRLLEKRGVGLDLAPCEPDGTLRPEVVAGRIRPNTRLLAVNHASNVCGTVLPVRELAVVAHQHGIPLLVDAAQTAGSWPIDVSADRIDLLAFSGHKGLLGPAGVGGLVFGPEFDVDRLPPLILGGTGSRSEFDEQPNFLPDKYEPGTPNSAGLAGLAAGVEYLLVQGLSAIRAREQELAAVLIAGLQRIAGVRVLGTRDAARQVGVVSFVCDSLSPSELAAALDDRFGVLCRPGLHCAPQAHRTLGTFPGGTVRFAPGPFTTMDEVEEAVAAVAQLVGVQ